MSGPDFAPLGLALAAVGGALLGGGIFALRRARKRRARITIRVGVALDLEGEFRLRVARRPLSRSELERLDPLRGRRRRFGGRVYLLEQGHRIGFVTVAPGTWYIAAAGSVADPVTDEKVGELREERRVQLGPREAREIVFEVRTRASSPAPEPVHGSPDPLPVVDEDPTETPEEPAAAAAPAAVAERYEVRGELGRGRRGPVFQAYDRERELEVALRRLPGPVPAEAGRRLTQLEHPRIARVYDVADEGGSCVVATELVRGTTLRSHVRREGTLPVPELLRVARQTLEALSHAHARGVIHGALGSQNLMRTDDGELKILDLGLAGVVASRDERVSDLRALGGCLFELATGEPPRPDGTLPKSAREIEPGLPPFVDELMLRLVAVPPEAGFRSADEVLALLDWLEED